MLAVGALLLLKVLVWDEVDVALVDLVEGVALGLAPVLAERVHLGSALLEALHHLVEELELLVDVLHVLERVAGPI